VIKATKHSGIRDIWAGWRVEMEDLAHFYFDCNRHCQRGRI
jgi:hypothetical protein